MFVGLYVELCAIQSVSVHDGQMAKPHTKTNTKKGPHTWTDRNRQRDGHMDPYIIYSCVCVCVRAGTNI